MVKKQIHLKIFIVTGDLNIDTLDDSMGTNIYLSDLSRFLWHFLFGEFDFRKILFYSSFWNICRYYALQTNQEVFKKQALMKLVSVINTN